ncbi:MAG TPA: VTT domain-containing protein [Opitutaceae bacterium]|nr:VTT domain-containing protein [Opitutaceae bacterium]
MAFFIGMAILPAVGFPLLAFTLSAGPVFAPQLGMPLVAVLVIVSLTVNVALTYWLARYAFRPMLESLIKRMGYSLPQVAADDHLSLAIIVRVTPGPPFFVQGYLLGLAKVPFWTYMIVSTLFAGAFSLAVLFFGESIVNGRGKMAFLAFSAFVALTVLVHWMRKRYTRGKKMADVV